MRAAALVLAVLLAAGCSSGSTKSAATSSPTPRTAYTDLTPPTSPGVGTFTDLQANRAYLAAQGFLAGQLLEPTAVNGVGGPQLAALIRGAAGDPRPGRALAGATPAGLTYRPLLARGVTLAKDFATVVRSEYTGDAVSGPGGEQALRITWSGAVHYAVTYQGKPFTFSYSLAIAYLFTVDPRDAAAVTLQVTVPHTFHVAPVQFACLKKGVVLPVAGAISAVDDSAGPWPNPKPGPACPA